MSSLPYAYELPANRIAQRPVRPYDSAKLLITDRSTSEISEARFTDLPDLLGSGDLLVFNNSRVIPARLFGTLAGGATIELLLLERSAGTVWRALGRPLRKFREGALLHLPANVQARVVRRRGQNEVEVEFLLEEHEIDRYLAEAGIMPIPPYVRDGCGDDQDRQDYQPPFAKEAGSVAAATASLHFTPDLLIRLQSRGCQIAELTLHVGTASFMALAKEGEAVVTAPTAERCCYSAALLDQIAAVKQQGRRVIAVGTTVMRALESMARQRIDGDLEEGELFEAAVFIRPGEQLMTATQLITNFHQPRTTHMFLVEAAMGRQLLDRAYQYALAHDFRFLSYGDGMIIL